MSSIQIIEPTDILDNTKSGEFREQVKVAITSGAEIILIDLEKVTFVDSSGLGALVVALKAVRAAGGKMYLCSINDQIRMLFELTSMDRVFQVLDSREDFEEFVTAKN